MEFEVVPDRYQRLKADHDPLASGFSLLGLLIVLAIVACTAWFMIERYASTGVGNLADAGAPLDETRRQRTITDLRTISRAIALRQADRGSYPSTLHALEVEGYFARVPPLDGWGSAWVYSMDAGGFDLRSLGSDGRAGPDPPVPWTGGSYACDLVVKNGQLTQAPSGS